MSDASIPVMSPENFEAQRKMREQIYSYKDRPKELPEALRALNVQLKSKEQQSLYSESKKFYAEKDAAEALVTSGAKGLDAMMAGAIPAAKKADPELGKYLVEHPESSLVNPDNFAKSGGSLSGPESLWSAAKNPSSYLSSVGALNPSGQSLQATAQQVHIPPDMKRAEEAFVRQGQPEAAADIRKRGAESPFYQRYNEFLAQRGHDAAKLSGGAFLRTDLPAGTDATGESTGDMVARRVASGVAGLAAGLEGMSDTLTLGAPELASKAGEALGGTDYALEDAKSVGNGWPRTIGQAAGYALPGAAPVKLGKALLGKLGVSTSGLVGGAAMGGTMTAIDSLARDASQAGLRAFTGQEDPNADRTTSEYLLERGGGIAAGTLVGAAGGSVAPTMGWLGKNIYDPAAKAAKSVAGEVGAAVSKPFERASGVLYNKPSIAPLADRLTQIGGELGFSGGQVSSAAKAAADYTRIPGASPQLPEKFLAGQIIPKVMEGAKSLEENEAAFAGQAIADFAESPTGRQRIPMTNTLRAMVEEGKGRLKLKNPVNGEMAAGVAPLPKGAIEGLADPSMRMAHEAPPTSQLRKPDDVIELTYKEAKEMGLDDLIAAASRRGKVSPAFQQAMSRGDRLEAAELALVDAKGKLTAAQNDFDAESAASGDLSMVGGASEKLSKLQAMLDSWKSIVDVRQKAFEVIGKEPPLSSSTLVLKGRPMDYKTAHAYHADWLSKRSKAQSSAMGQAVNEPETAWPKAYEASFQDLDKWVPIPGDHTASDAVARVVKKLGGESAEGLVLGNGKTVTGASALTKALSELRHNNERMWQKLGINKSFGDLQNRSARGATAEELLASSEGGVLSNKNAPSYGNAQESALEAALMRMGPENASVREALGPAVEASSHSGEGPTPQQLLDYLEQHLIAKRPELSIPGGEPRLTIGTIDALRQALTPSSVAKRAYPVLKSVSESPYARMLGYRGLSVGSGLGRSQDKRGR